MKRNDRYVHFKGGLYVFIGIVLPLNNLKESTADLIFKWDAMDESTLKKVPVYCHKGILLSQKDVPLVLYQSDKDGQYWLRAIDDFFGNKEKEDGTFVKRFRLLKQLEDE